MLIIIAHIVADGMRNEACFLTLHFCCAGGEGGGRKKLSRDNPIVSEIAQNVPFGWDF